MKKGVPLPPCPKDFVCSEVLAFLDIPYDVGVNAVAFLGQQITTNVSEKESAQHLETVYRTGEIWCLLVYHAVHFCEPLGTGSTNPRDFRIDAAQPKVRAEPNTPRRPRTLQRDLEAARQDGAGQWVMRRLMHHRIQHPASSGRQPRMNCQSACKIDPPIRVACRGHAQPVITVVTCVQATFLRVQSSVSFESPGERRFAVEQPDEETSWAWQRTHPICYMRRSGTEAAKLDTTARISEPAESQRHDQFIP